MLHQTFEQRVLFFMHSHVFLPVPTTFLASVRRGLQLGLSLIGNVINVIRTEIVVFQGQEGSSTVVCTLKWFNIRPTIMSTSHLSDLLPNCEVVGQERGCIGVWCSGGRARRCDGLPYRGSTNQFVSMIVPSASWVGCWILILANDVSQGNLGILTQTPTQVLFDTLNRLGPILIIYLRDIAFLVTFFVAFEFTQRPNVRQCDVSSRHDPRRALLVPKEECSQLEVHLGTHGNNISRIGYHSWDAGSCSGSRSTSSSNGRIRHLTAWATQGLAKVDDVVVCQQLELIKLVDTLYVGHGRSHGVIDTKTDHGGAKSWKSHDGIDGRSKGNGGNSTTIRRCA